MRIARILAALSLAAVAFVAGPLADAAVPGTTEHTLAAQDRGYPYKSHLAGGIIAWKAAGLPTKS